MAADWIFLRSEINCPEKCFDQLNIALLLHPRRLQIKIKNEFL